MFRGSGEDGQLGLGNNEERERVCTITSLLSNEVSSVVAGSRNSLAICADGKVSPKVFTQLTVLFFFPIVLCLILEYIFRGLSDKSNNCFRGFYLFMGFY